MTEHAVGEGGFGGRGENVAGDDPRAVVTAIGDLPRLTARRQVARLETAGEIVDEADLQLGGDVFAESVERDRPRLSRDGAG